MRNRSLVMQMVCLVMVAAFFTGCVGLMAKPTEKNFINPKITLSHVEVPYYVGYYYLSKKAKVTKGDQGNYGAPMNMAFIFDIENPNKYPVALEDFKFTVLFEDFEVNTVSSPEVQWIPAGKTNQLRVIATFDTRQTLLTLLLPGAMKMKEKKTNPWALLEKWWKGAPDFSYPVSVKEGAAVFKADGLVKVVPFEGVFP